MGNNKRILAVMSEWGYWGIELVGPLNKLVAAGYEFDFVTPKGKRSPVLPPSTDTSYQDPPLGVRVTTPEDAALVLAFEKTNQLDKTLNLTEMFPERPYFSSDNFLRQFEAYYKNRRVAQEQAVAKYDAILLVGGSGPIVDMVNNQRVHDLILAFHSAGKPIGAICYGVACLVFARELDDRACILRGKHVTGHCIEYDYKDGTGFLGVDFNMGPPPYSLEYLLRDAVGPEGKYHGNFGKQTSVIVDYPFITARSNQCSYEFGEKLIEVLDKGMRRYGW